MFSKPFKIYDRRYPVPTPFRCRKCGHDSFQDEVVRYGNDIDAKTTCLQCGHTALSTVNDFGDTLHNHGYLTRLAPHHPYLQKEAAE